MAISRVRAGGGRTNAAPARAARAAIRSVPTSASAASRPPFSVWSATRKRAIARKKPSDVVAHTPDAAPPVKHELGTRSILQTRAADFVLGLLHDAARPC